MHGDSSNGSFCMYVPKLIMLGCRRCLPCSPFCSPMRNFHCSFMYCHFMEKAMMIRLMPNRNFRIGSSILVCLSDENLARKLEVHRSTEYVFHANKTCIYALQTALCLEKGFGGNKINRMA